MEDGSVRIPGVTWTCASHIEDAPGRFDATAAGDCDVGENGVRRLVLDHLQGAPPAAIPVFFGREHMQRNLLVREDSSLTHPRDLAGKMVGCRLPAQSGTCVGVMMLLEQGYGVALDQVRWRLGNPQGLPNNRMGLDLKPGVRTDEANFDLLVKGELDAVIVIRGPRYWSLFGLDQIDKTLANYPGIRPLITDPAVIADTYRRTGLYPITDMVVVTSDLVAQDPELPVRLVQAFSQANSLAHRYRSSSEEALAREEIQLLGEDPHRYGLEANQHHNLAVFIDFLYRLGAIERSLGPEELFVPSVRG